MGLWHAIIIRIIGYIDIIVKFFKRTSIESNLDNQKHPDPMAYFNDPLLPFWFILDVSIWIKFQSIFHFLAYHIQKKIGLLRSPQNLHFKRKTYIADLFRLVIFTAVLAHTFQPEICVQRFFPFYVYLVLNQCYLAPKSKKLVLKFSN